LRDRGYIYWRLLSADPQAAKEVVLAEKPLISEETDLLEPSLLNQLVMQKADFINSQYANIHMTPSDLSHWLSGFRLPQTAILLRGPGSSSGQDNHGGSNHGNVSCNTICSLIKCSLLL
jgi:hypothetical protein